MRRKNNARHGGAGQLRIIAGEWRGRKLPVADIEGLRPTPDRVRETVFNWLAPYIPGARVLDCFSGSGALSLESLSRGASSAVMLEKASAAAQALISNLVLLSASQGAVVNTDSLVWLSRPAEAPFDVVFLDPPFRKELLEQTCQLLITNGYVSSDTVVYIEAEKELSLAVVPESWHLFKEKVAGQVRYSLWRVGG